jgi:GntR family transcriptional regulator/MocR family aminotransferase
MPEGGLAVWSNFDKKIDLVKLSKEASKKGLHIDDGNFYKNESFVPNALRMGFASLNENEMVKALNILKTVVH